MIRSKHHSEMKMLSRNNTNQRFILNFFILFRLKGTPVLFMLCVIHVDVASEWNPLIFEIYFRSYSWSTIDFGAEKTVRSSKNYSCNKRLSEKFCWDLLQTKISAKLRTKSVIAKRKQNYHSSLKNILWHL